MKTSHRLPDTLPLEKGEYLRMKVSCGGEPLDAETISKLFDPYANMQKTGEGLGLASSFSIVRRHGGLIDVRSGDVTTFHIYLRKALDAVPAETNRAAAAKKAPDLNGQVLLMDDEDFILDVAEKMLAHLGLSVVRTHEGQEAIDEYRKSMDENRVFDFIIMDLTVPGGMGGREAMARLREIDPSVKGVVSSGYSNDAVMANYREYGFSGVLLKPYRIEDVKKLVNEMSLL